MNRRGLLILLGILVVLQGAALVVFLTVEEDREDTARRERVTNDAPPVDAQIQLRNIQVLDAQRRPIDLTKLEAPTVVHVWATWCAPCMDELPDLLRWARENDARLLAVSVDQNWNQVIGFVPEGYDDLLAHSSNGRISEVAQISSLPATLLVEPGGLVTKRADGARDWTSPTFTNAWDSALRTGGQ